MKKVQGDNVRKSEKWYRSELRIEQKKTTLEKVKRERGEKKRREST